MHDPESDGVRVFEHTDINKVLCINSSFHFNRGDHNFFSGYGRAAYSCWARTFTLLDDEVKVLNDDHDLALTVLIGKLNDFIVKHQLNAGHVKKLKDNFDLNGKWQAILFTPNSLPPVIFDLNYEDMRFLVDLEMGFSYRVIAPEKIEVLRRGSK